MTADATIERAKGQWEPKSAPDVPTLQAMYHGVVAAAKPVGDRADAASEAAEKAFAGHHGTLGVREKYLRGWFGGNKDAVAQSDRLKSDMAGAKEAAVQVAVFVDDVETAARARVRDLTCASDPAFAALCDDQKRLDKAASAVSRLSSEVARVIGLLDEAEALQIRKDGGEESAGFAAGQARKKASAAVAELNKSLPTRTRELADLGVNVGQLTGSNVKVAGGVGEFLLGDTWSEAVSGLSATGKLDKATVQLMQLRKRVGGIHQGVVQQKSGLDRQIARQVQQTWGIPHSNGMPPPAADEATDELTDDDDDEADLAAGEAPIAAAEADPAAHPARGPAV